MRFASVVSALAFAAIALAQDQTIQVGEANGAMALKFSPAAITAKNGSVITFVFDGVPGNHTVAQSTFATPCSPMAGGFDSGFFFTNSSTGPFGVWNLSITDDTKPIWFYCSQVKGATHCNAGMVGAINAPTTGNTFEAFLSKATGLPTASILQPTPALVGHGASASAGVATTDSINTPSTSNSSSTSTTLTGSVSSTGTTSTGGSSSTGTTSTTSLSSASPASAISGTTSVSGATSTRVVSSSSPGAAVTAMNTTTTTTGSGAAAVGVNGVVAAVAAAFGIALSL